MAALPKCSGISFIDEIDEEFSEQVKQFYKITISQKPTGVTLKNVYKDYVLSTCLYTIPFNLFVMYLSTIDDKF